MIYTFSEGKKISLSVGNVFQGMAARYYSAAGITEPGYRLVIMALGDGFVVYNSYLNFSGIWKKNSVGRRVAISDIGNDILENHLVQITVFDKKFGQDIPNTPFELDDDEIWDTI